MFQNNLASGRVILQPINELDKLDKTISGIGCSGMQTFAFFLGVEQVYNRVWHEDSIHKLREILDLDCYVHLIASFLRNKTFCARVDGFLPQERTSTAGVPQGSVLEPPLISVYVSDVPKHSEVELSMFANDTAAYSVDRYPDYGVPKLQRQLDAYVDWAEK